MDGTNFLISNQLNNWAKVKYIFQKKMKNIKYKQAPEAIEKREYSEKTDVWSFGITIIEILTRESPYPNKTRVEVITSVSKGELPIEFNEEWSNEATKQFLIEKCFAFDANQRSSFKVNLNHS